MVKKVVPLDFNLDSWNDSVGDYCWGLFWNENNLFACWIFFLHLWILILKC